jgi:hypothetical protein
LFDLSQKLKNQTRPKIDFVIGRGIADLSGAKQVRNQRGAVGANGTPPEIGSRPGAALFDPHQ